MTVPEPPALMTAERVAQLTGLHYQTVLEAIRRGDLRALKLGNRWRVRPADYDAWLDAHLAPARDPVPPRAGLTPPRRARAHEAAPGSLARLAAIERRSRP